MELKVTYVLPSHITIMQMLLQYKAESAYLMNYELTLYFTRI
jgi:hypothetical protein